MSMNSSLRRIAPIALILAACSFPARAQPSAAVVEEQRSPRIAVWNSELVLKGYSAAQEGEKAIQSRVSTLQATLERKNVVRRTLSEKLTTLVNAPHSDDPNWRQELDQLSTAISDTDKEIRALTASPELAATLKSYKERTGEAVREAVQKVAAAKHCSVVLDLAAITSVNIPVVTVVNGAQTPENITEPVLKELNATAAAPAEVDRPELPIPGATRDSGSTSGRAKGE